MENYINKKFNRLTILKDSGRDKYSHKLVEVQCDCEKQTIFTTRLRSVLDNATTSCGCYNKEIVKENCKKHNSYDLTKEYGIGYANKTNKEFYFDLEDYNKIKDICWSVSSDNRVGGYHKGKYILIHKIITDTTSQIIDHINLNPRDNRKENLRFSNKSKNAMNKKGHGKMSEFGLKGINWHKLTKVWHNQIKKGNKVVYSKYFDNILDAINDKIKFEKEYFGEYRYVWENDIDLEELLEYEKELKK